MAVWWVRELYRWYIDVDTNADPTAMHYLTKLNFQSLVWKLRWKEREREADAETKEENNEGRKEGIERKELL